MWCLRLSIEDLLSLDLQVITAAKTLHPGFALLIMLLLLQPMVSFIIMYEKRVLDASSSTPEAQS
jgi:hypothetical protein